MLDYINDYNMERSENHEISLSDKIEYNLLLEKANKYAKETEEFKKKYNKAFMKLIEKMDKLILEMGVDNATQQEWQNGFIIKEGDDDNE